MSGRVAGAFRHPHIGAVGDAAGASGQSSCASGTRRRNLPRPGADALNHLLAAGVLTVSRLGRGAGWSSLGPHGGPDARGHRGLGAHDAGQLHAAARPSLAGGAGVTSNSTRSQSRVLTPTAEITAGRRACQPGTSQALPPVLVAPALATASGRRGKDQPELSRSRQIDALVESADRGISGRASPHSRGMSGRPPERAHTTD